MLYNNFVEFIVVVSRASRNTGHCWRKTLAAWMTMAIESQPVLLLVVSIVYTAPQRNLGNTNSSSCTVINIYSINK